VDDPPGRDSIPFRDGCHTVVSFGSGVSALGRPRNSAWVWAALQVSSLPVAHLGGDIRLCSLLNSAHVCTGRLNNKL
jgi:hypothetical protein